MSERTLAQRFSDELDSFLRLMKERPVYAWLLVIVFAAWACFACFGRYSHKEEVRALHAEIEKLQTNLRQSEFENTSLKQTIAPLLAQAAKEFPGEEINSSLKKIVTQLEKSNPLDQPIASASSSVVLLTENSGTTRSTHFMDRGGYAIFVKDSKPLLATVARESRKVYGENGTRWLGDFTMPADDSAVGLPVKMVQHAKLIQVRFAKLEAQTKVLGGTVVFVLNGNVRLEFQIPSQAMTNGNAIIRGAELEAGLARITSQ